MLVSKCFAQVSRDCDSVFKEFTVIKSEFQILDTSKLVVFYKLDSISFLSSLDIIIKWLRIDFDLSDKEIIEIFNDSISKEMVAKKAIVLTRMINYGLCLVNFNGEFFNSYSRTRYKNRKCSSVVTLRFGDNKTLTYFDGVY